MKTHYRLLLLVSVFIVSVHVEAQTRRLQIQSKADQYELVLTGQNGTVNGKPADLSTLRDLLPLLTTAIDNECTPQKGKADVTVRENGKTRSIYLKEGVVSEGKNCVAVGGEGLLYFPVHRDFLIGPKRGSLTLKSPVKVSRQGETLFELKKVGDAWTSENPKFLLNWDFLDRFETSLHDYEIRFRVAADLAKDKPSVTVVSGGNTYEFYKITNVNWAVKKPGTRWLEASDDWSFWYDFEDGVLEDRFAPQIAVLEDKSKPMPERKEVLAKLENNWSRNLRDCYHKLLLDRNEDHDIQAIALKRLHGKPSKETAEVMVKFVEQTNDEDFKKLANQIIKINSPKGANRPNSRAKP